MAWRLSPESPRLLALLGGMLAASTVVFAQLAEEVAASEPPVPLDGAVSDWLHTNATGFATTVLSAVTWLGGAQLLLAITIVAVLALLVRRRVAHAALMGAALAGGEALNWGLKAAFERPRP